MKRFLLRLAGLGAILAAIGALVVISGIVPIKASSGHWPITEWFLQFAKRRSVATHSMGAKPPPLDDPALILKGATHYEMGCRSCHGGPGTRMPRIAQAMTPKPPYLPTRTEDMSDAEIFYIIQHGIKFTGMPAWPAPQREDEVWALVAFLRKLPHLDRAAYEELAGTADSTVPMESMLGVENIPQIIQQSCIRCHGSDGLGRGSPAFPILAGQRQEYLVAALKAYAEGERHSGIMQPIAAALSEQDIQDLAQYYANQPPRRGESTQESREERVRGEQIYREGDANLGIPSCIDCHGADQGRSDYPLLKGQPAEYLRLQLELFKERHRGGSPFSHLMHPVADSLSPEDQRAVAEYIQKLNSNDHKPALQDD